MREVFEPMLSAPDDPESVFVRRVLYALPHEVWRIEAMLLVCQVAASLGRWDEGLERVKGKLLGYEDRQIDAFVKRILEKC